MEISTKTVTLAADKVDKEGWIWNSETKKYDLILQDSKGKARIVEIVPSTEVWK